MGEAELTRFSNADLLSEGAILNDFAAVAEHRRPKHVFTDSLSQLPGCQSGHHERSDADVAHNCLPPNWDDEWRDLAAPAESELYARLNDSNGELLPGRHPRRPHLDDTTVNQSASGDWDDYNSPAALASRTEDSMRHNRLVYVTMAYGKDTQDTLPSGSSACAHLKYRIHSSTAKMNTLSPFVRGECRTVCEGHGECDASRGVSVNAS